jgi:hypothetical protein
VALRADTIEMMIRLQQDGYLKGPSSVVEIGARHSTAVSSALATEWNYSGSYSELPKSLIYSKRAGAGYAAIDIDGSPPTASFWI